MNNFQIYLLDFIDNEDDAEIHFQYLIKFLNDQQIQKNRQDIKSFLHLICSISNNHYRCPHFYSKIERILHFFQNEIKKYFSNFEIFNIFKSNKRILLYLIEIKILKVDESIYYQIMNQKYGQYFSPEIKKFTESNGLTEKFEEKRKLGENDSYICSLIRQDMVTEFISYINQTNLSLSSKISHSIFETNSFLIKNKETKLIEYAAFFGSIQIFQFLLMNNVDLTSSLWLYTIHGRNAQMIHILEENHVEFKENFSSICLYESIKCFHNELAEYFQNNYFDNERENHLKTFLKGLKYHNFAFLEKDYINKSILFDLCKYDYFLLVEFLLKTNGNININECIIKQICFF